MSFEASSAHDAGLKAGATALAKVHFGKFPNKFANYRLSACIFSDSAPEAAISCAGEFGIVVNTKDDASSGGGGDSSGGGGDSGGGSDSSGGGDSSGGTGD